MNTSCRSFSIAQDQKPSSGYGDVVQLARWEDGTVHLRVVRQGKRADGRDQRSISIALDRAEALALGRQLIAEASGLVVLDRPASEFQLHVNVWNKDARGPFLTSLSASLVADEVLLSMDRMRSGSDGRFGFEGEQAVLLEIDEMRDFARSLLAACER